MVTAERSTLPSFEAMIVYAMVSLTDDSPSPLSGAYVKVLVMATDGSWGQHDASAAARRNVCLFMGSACCLTLLSLSPVVSGYRVAYRCPPPNFVEH